MNTFESSVDKLLWKNNLHPRGLVLCQDKLSAVGHGLTYGARTIGVDSVASLTTRKPTLNTLCQAG